MVKAPSFRLLSITCEMELAFNFACESTFSLKTYIDYMGQVI